MSQPVKIRRFFPGDLTFPALIVMGLGLTIGAYLTPQDPPVPLVGWVILWLVNVMFILINIMFVIHRLKMGKNLKYVTRNMVVGWTDAKWAVKDTEFESSVDAYITKMRPKYPQVEKALAGCVVIFREPKWAIDQRKGKVAKYIAGLQDYNILEVGWNQYLTQTALWHEMTHRVFQLFEGDPPQDKAHEMMSKLGVS